MGRSMGSVFSDLYATGHSSRFVLSSYSSEGILHLNLSAFHILGGVVVSTMLEPADTVQIIKKTHTNDKI